MFLKPSAGGTRIGFPVILHTDVPGNHRFQIVMMQSVVPWDVSSEDSEWFRGITQLLIDESDYSGSHTTALCPPTSHTGLGPVAIQPVVTLGVKLAEEANVLILIAFQIGAWIIAASADAVGTDSRAVAE